MKETIVRKKVFDIKPFSKLIIGDPMYLDHIAEGTASAGEKKLCFIKEKYPVSDCRAKVVLQDVHVDFDDETDDLGSWDRWSICFFSQKEKDLPYASAFLRGRMYPYFVQENKELVCDTARFSITVDDNNMPNIDTGSDGYYGHVTHYKNNDMIGVQLDLDPGMMSEDEVIDMIRYLFTVTKEYDWKEIAKENEEEK